MASTLLRSGLWVIFFVIVMYVLHDTYEDSPLVEFFSPAVMQRTLILGSVLLGGGLVASLFRKKNGAVAKSRCVICNAPIVKGGIYCRDHLKRVLDLEEERTHRSRGRETG